MNKKVGSFKNYSKDGERKSCFYSDPWDSANFMLVSLHICNAGNCSVFILHPSEVIYNSCMSIFVLAFRNKLGFTAPCYVRVLMGLRVF